MMVLQILLSLAGVLAVAQAQAPGDGSMQCLQEYIDGHPNPFYSMRPVYGENVRPLMDSRHYMSLLLGDDAAWQQVDADSNNMQGLATNWFQLSSAPCSGNIFVCGFSAGAQENWLITQHISRQLSGGQLLGSVTVKIEYEFQLCSRERQCVQNIELHKRETSAIDSNIAMKIENFVLVGSFPPNISNNGSGTQQGRIDVEFDTEESGIYLALVDRGTCIFVHRVLVFYNGVLCSGVQTGLIRHPEVLPPQERVVGKCAGNSSTLSGLDPVIQCTDEGSWNVLTPCLCGPGFELTVANRHAYCTECPRGTFSVGLSNSSCLPCPANTIIQDSQLGLTYECPCIHGYFKAPSDIYSVPCTTSPSAPRDLTVSGVTNTSALLSWSPPDNDGGRPGVFYTVHTYFNGSLAKREFVMNKTAHTATGLTPGVLYTFSVSSENAVSSEDSNVNDRSINITATTLQGVPSSVRDIQEHCTVIVWKRPAEPNGIIISYLLTFERGVQTTDVRIEPSYHYHVIQPSDIPPGIGPVTVEVRAQNILGLSPHPEHKPTISCLSERSTPEPSPVTPECPSCPPPPVCPSPDPCPSCPSIPPPTCSPCPEITVPPPRPTPPPCPSSPPTTPSEETPTVACPAPPPFPTCEPCPTCQPPTPFPTCPPPVSCPEPVECPACPTCPPDVPFSPEPSCNTCPPCPENTCPTCKECPAEVFTAPGLVSNIRMILCKTLSWDVPRDGGRCISEYRVRIFNGKTYGSSSQRRVVTVRQRNMTLSWVPSRGTTSINVRAKNGAGLARSWGSTYHLPSDALSCGK